MPKYDYCCNDCTAIYETSDNPESIQCTCGGTMTRIWTAPAVVFRGKGFYSTDNR